MALSAALIILATACAALPLFNRIGALEKIAGLMGVAVISIAAGWRTIRFARGTSEERAGASDLAPNGTDGEFADPS